MAAPDAKRCERCQSHSARRVGARREAGRPATWTLPRPAFLTSRGFFPTLISPAFAQGLLAAFGFAAVACLIAALASLLRGGRYVYGESAGLAGPPGEGTAADSASPASRR